MSLANRHSWTSTSLSNSDLFAFESGVWTGKKPPFVSCSVLRNTNFAEDGQLDFADIAEIEIEERLLERKTLLPGNIILERSGGGPTQPVGRVAYFDKHRGRFCFSNFTSRLRVLRPEVIDSRFLHLYLHSAYVSGRTERLQRRTTGIRNLDFGEYQKLLVPLPPIATQRAIAHILQTVQKAKETRQRELALERERKAALMEHLFMHGTRGEATKETEIGEIPESWDIQRLGALLTSVTNGLTSEQNKSGSGLPITRIETIASDRINPERVGYAQHLTEEQQSKYRLMPGDILFSHINSEPQIGRAVMYQGIPDVLLHGMNLLRLTVNKDFALPNFLTHLLGICRSRGWLKALAARAVGQSSINQGKLKALLVPVPPLAEQADIASCLDAADSLISARERELDLLTELFNALLESLFSGQLSVEPVVRYEEHV